MRVEVLPAVVSDQGNQETDEDRIADPVPSGWVMRQPMSPIWPREDHDRVQPRWAAPGVRR